MGSRVIVSMGRFWFCGLLGVVLVVVVICVFVSMVMFTLWVFSLRVFGCCGELSLLYVYLCLS